MNGQINITFVIDYESINENDLEEKEKASILAEMIHPNFASRWHGMKIINATAFYQDEEVLYY